MSLLSSRLAHVSLRQEQVVPSAASILASTLLSVFVLRNVSRFECFQDQIFWDRLSYSQPPDTHTRTHTHNLLLICLLFREFERSLECGTLFTQRSGIHHSAHSSSRGIFFTPEELWADLGWVAGLVSRCRRNEEGIFEYIWIMVRNKIVQQSNT